MDLKTKRGGEASFKHIEGSVRVINEAGTISHDLMIEIRDAFLTGRPKRIEVEGEEDLAVIPIIFYAPLNTVVAYGVPDVGMACIRVTPEEKDRVTRMLEMMVNG
ncbi:GTP-dependent dephospho-CoA kinase family protein [Thermogymnomonas acidicola]|uniref:GTP-dependent dephospho-CoA kinase family protein n=1 Tax=Thermogymnomonas acidicola TaxID=399579 RepID=UPI000A78A39D|nr:GTP-dependent dephospho-CoA kinase family protein [Thermogymnomonas acidicola]